MNGEKRLLKKRRVGFGSGNEKMKSFFIAHTCQTQVYTVHRYTIVCICIVHTSLTNIKNQRHL